MRTIIEEELQPYEDGEQVRISGDDAPLPAALAQAIAVAIHELATNAAKIRLAIAAFGQARSPLLEERGRRLPCTTLV